MSILVKHFVTNPRVLINIGELSLEQAEKDRLTEIATLIYHQKLLNKFLDNLAEEDKKIFIEKVLTDPKEDSLNFLHEKIDGIERVVEEAIFEIEEKLLEDIKALEE